MATNKTCAAEGCDKPVRSQGLCISHYNWAREQGKLKPKIKGSRIGTKCSVPKCEGYAYARTWCKKHYMMWLRTGTTDRKRTSREGQICIIEGCERPVFGKGWCVAHYARDYQKLGVAMDAPIRPYTKYRENNIVCSAPGCIKPAVVKGMCRQHYDRKKYREHGPRNATATENAAHEEVPPQRPI